MGSGSGIIETENDRVFKNVISLGNRRIFK